MNMDDEDGLDQLENDMGEEVNGVVLLCFQTHC